MIGNRSKKLIAMVDKRSGDLIGVARFNPIVRRPLHPENPGAPREIPEVSWEQVLHHGVGFNQSDESGEPLLEPVAIVDCDGASKLSPHRLTARNGEPPEAKLEACMEVSADRALRGPPIDNTFSQARRLVEKARDQEFPMRRPHHPTRDHKRIHCIGRLARTTAQERATKAQQMRGEIEQELAAGVATPSRAQFLETRITRLRDFENGA